MLSVPAGERAGVRGGIDVYITQVHDVHMKYATIAEFRNHLAAYLRRVEKGERILIRRRGEVIAELRPSSGEERTEPESLERRLEALEREGFLRCPTKPWPEWTRGPITGEAAPLLEALLDERENGR